MMFFKTGNIASTVKRILQREGGSSFLFYFWLKEKMEALYNLTTIFRSPELKCHIFNRLYSLRCFILFSISNFRKVFFLFIIVIIIMCIQAHYLNFRQNSSISVAIFLCECNTVTVIAKQKLNEKEADDILLFSYFMLPIFWMRLIPEKIWISIWKSITC